jgi:hypothetical protein
MRSFSIKEAARALDCSTRTIYSRIRDGRLLTIRRQTSQRVTAGSLWRECQRRDRPVPASWTEGADG